MKTAMELKKHYLELDNKLAKDIAAGKLTGAQIHRRLYWLEKAKGEYIKAVMSEQ